MIVLVFAARLVVGLFIATLFVVALWYLDSLGGA